MPLYWHQEKDFSAQMDSNRSSPPCFFFGHRRDRGHGVIPGRIPTLGRGTWGYAKRYDAAFATHASAELFQAGRRFVNVPHRSALLCDGQGNHGSARVTRADVDLVTRGDEGSQSINFPRSLADYQQWHCSTATFRPISAAQTWC